MKARASHRRARGYTFAEVLVASALLGMGIGGAVSLTATMNTQHAAALSQSVAYNYHDNGARLWQLGLSSTEALSVLPDVRDNADLESAIVPATTGSDKQLSFTSVTNTTLATSMGTISVDAYRAKIR
jgi:Tfp pilus assembly protein PilV